MARTNTLIVAASFEDATRYWLWYFGLIIGITIVGIPALIIILPIIYIAKTIEYKHLSCELHQRSVKVKRGWLNKREQTIPLDKITDLGIHQNFLMRRLGVEGITIETAGQSAGATALVMLVGMRDARGFRDTVLDQRDRLAYGEDPTEPTHTTQPNTPSHDPNQPPTPASTPETTQLLRDIHNELKALRADLQRQE
ncbi:MAG: PH domain-containing protein [Phycisphaerales bacterium]